MTSSQHHELAEMRDFWSARLCSRASDVIDRVFENMAKEALAISGPRTYLMTFQEALQEIPAWNLMQIDEHSKKVTEKIHKLSEMLSAILWAHTKILTLNAPHGPRATSIEVTIPPLESVIHKWFIAGGNKIYQNSRLYRATNSLNEKYANTAAAKQLIAEAIEDAISDLVPEEMILSQYFAGISEAGDNQPPPLPLVAAPQPVQSPHAYLPMEDSHEETADDAETRQDEDEEEENAGEDDGEDTKTVSSDATRNTDNSKRVRFADDKEDSGSPEPSSTAPSESSQQAPDHHHHHDRPSQEQSMFEDDDEEVSTARN